MFTTDKTIAEQTVTHPSLEGMIEWLEKQPGKRTYNWLDCCDCLFLQYAMFSFGDRSKAVEWYCDSIPLAWEIAMSKPWTISAALARAKAALAARGERQ